MGGYEYNSPQISLFEHFAFLGLVDVGPLPWRPEDQVGFEVAFLRAGVAAIHPANPSQSSQSVPYAARQKTAPRPGTRRYFFSAGRPYIPTRVALASVWKCSSNPTSAADTLWSLAYCSFSSSTANTVKM